MCDAFTRPGTNPDTEPAHVVADLYAVTGGVSWDEATDGNAAATLRLTPPQRVGFDGSLVSPPMAVKELPKWVAGDSIVQLDRRASLTLAQTLQTDRPARVGLLELTARPQREVRSLALRCLGYLGQFHEMVVAMNDPTHKPDWTEYVEQLYEAVARGPESAAAVRQTLEKQYPQQAAALYRLLWGYSDDNLQAGSDRDLVNGLDDELLALRRLSIWNLQRVTGIGRIYQPEQTAKQRQPAVQRWEQRLKAKEIRLKTPEERAGASARESVSEMPAEAGP